MTVEMLGLSVIGKIGPVRYEGSGDSWRWVISE